MQRLTPQHPLSRIAILNRGEPALRFLRSLHEYNLERGLEIKAIAFATDPDSDSPFVHQSDSVVRLGPAMRSNGKGGMVSAYCDHNYVIELLKLHECDGVWPGWGFVSEDAAFVKLLEDAGILFLGPSSKSMHQLGDKIAAKKLAEDAGVPLAPWAEILDDDSEEAILEKANTVGFPLMLKASAGGGGRGIRKVESAQAVIASFESVREEATKSFGVGGIFMERCITDARHIEVQLLVNAEGESFALGVRDCSIQRRNQKVIEEAPSPILPPEVEKLLLGSAAKLAELAEYRGVGTAEFLYQPKSGVSTFLEVNSRLQVEHTITECVLGCDLVEAQLDTVHGIPWSPDTTTPLGHAIEMRVNAENPEKSFQPSPGKLLIFRPPSGPGVRVDSGVNEGMSIPPDFDSMIAKVIVWGPTRSQAIARARRAIQELDVVIEDGATNQAFLQEILKSEEFVSGRADTAWLDRAVSAGQFSQTVLWEEALLAAAILEHQRGQESHVSKFFSEVQDGIPQQITEPNGAEVALQLREHAWNIHVFCIDRHQYLVGPQSAHPSPFFPVSFHHRSPSIAEMFVRGVWRRVLFSYGSTGLTLEIDGHTHHVERAAGGVVRAPAPSVIVAIHVEEGQVIEAGHRLCTLEAMKMEMFVNATEGGVVKSVLCLPNQQVPIGHPLFEIEPEGNEKAEVSSQSFPFPPLRPLVKLLKNGRPDPTRFDDLPDEEIKEILEDLRSAVLPALLGFDQTPGLRNELTSLFGASVSFQVVRHPERWEPLLEILEIFADCASVLDRNLLMRTEESSSIPADVLFFDFCRKLNSEQESTKDLLRSALRWYGVDSLEPSDALREALWRLTIVHNYDETRHKLCSSVLRVLMQLHEAGLEVGERYQKILHRIAQTARSAFPYVRDNAFQALYLLYERHQYGLRAKTIQQVVDGAFSQLSSQPESKEVREAMDGIAQHTQSLLQPLLRSLQREELPKTRLVEGLVRRLYAGSRCDWHGDFDLDFACGIRGRVLIDDEETVPLLGLLFSVKDSLAALKWIMSNSENAAVELVFLNAEELDDQIWVEIRSFLLSQIEELPRRITFTWLAGIGERHCSFFRRNGRLEERGLLQNIHPEAARRVELWRLQNFHLERLSTDDRVYAFIGRAKRNPKDERIFILAEVFGDVGSSERAKLWGFESAYFESLRILRDVQSQRTQRTRLRWNWMHFYIHPALELSSGDLHSMARDFEPYVRGLSVREVNIRLPLIKNGKIEPTEIAIRKTGRHRLELTQSRPSFKRIQEMSTYEQRVVQSSRRGCVYPYEIIRMLEGQRSANQVDVPHPDIGQGRFQEYDYDETGVFSPVVRPLGMNSCGVVVGIMTNCTLKYPDGMPRVWVGSDSTRAMGALAEPECRRIIAALEIAEQFSIPVEWIPVSSGAKISMDSGTENLDWTAKVLRQIILFTQKGGIINLIIHNVNVGAQSYWNAEATMLMHTRGCLIMTMDGAMVLTGKKALDFSGSVSAEDERGIGGAERIMGPNGQAQFIAEDLGDAYRILFEWYRITYRNSKESQPRRFNTTDPFERSIVSYPYKSLSDDGFETVGEIFSLEGNPGRKRPFSIRALLGAVIDQDAGHLERFGQIRDGENAVVWESHIGGFAVTLLGIESRPLPRRGRIPMDGPSQWMGGTLFPVSSKKIARAINSASNNRPLVVLANLSGFDGSPESMRRLQLEMGAEIGRAVVNFEGPIVFVVVGRYHGGAYVVFSKALNPQLRSFAVEGSFASVIGGAPAAAVVFPREVIRRANEDPRVIELEGILASATPAKKSSLRERLELLKEEVGLEKRGEVAQEFDGIHSVHRAVEVGSLDGVISAENLRPTIITELQNSIKSES